MMQSISANSKAIKKQPITKVQKKQRTVPEKDGISSISSDDDGQNSAHDSDGADIDESDFVSDANNGGIARPTSMIKVTRE